MIDIELNQMYCSESVGFIKDNIPDDYIDLTVTSPPYDNLRTYNGYDFNIENMAKELYRVTKKGGIVVWIVSDATVNGTETGTSFKQALRMKEEGFNLHDTMIWFKDSVRFPDTVRYYDSFEYMFVFSKGKPKTINLIKDKPNKWYGTKVHGTDRNPDGSKKSKSGHNKKEVKKFGVRYNLWTMHNVGVKGRSHPAVFPEKLAEDHILSWSNENDIVLDPMCGSGTTCKMAKSNNRNFVGIDISDEYIKLANERLDIFT